jgi:hypothetical protein
VWVSFLNGECEDNMTNEKKLLIIKTIHTAIWLFYVFVFFYILYAGIYNKLDKLLWASIGLVILEGLVLIVNRWKCPLTVLANRYSKNPETGFDIFLPNILAKHNKTIFVTLFIFDGLSSQVRQFV